VLLVPGCVQRALAPSIDAAAVRVLARQDVRIETLRTVECCGSLAYHLGKAEISKAYARRLIEALRTRVQRGEDLSELARKYSDDGASRANGGETSFASGRMVVEFEAAAAALAIGLGAARIVFCSDVPGLLRHGLVVPSIAAREAGVLLAEGTLQGGMVPKLTAAVVAARRGVRAEIGQTLVSA
jgi:hypothetical protein